jgi:hypothetical protein
VCRVNLDGTIQVLEVDWEELGRATSTRFKLFQICPTSRVVIL